jgi:ankyrin repeat protein
VLDFPLLCESCACCFSLSYSYSSSATQDNEKQTALMLALEKGHDDIAKLLIEHGTDLNEEVMKHSNNMRPSRKNSTRFFFLRIGT